MGFEKSHTTFLSVEKVVQKINFNWTWRIDGVSLSINIFNYIDITSVSQLFIMILDVFFHFLECQKIIFWKFLIVGEAFTFLDNHYLFALDFFKEFVDTNWIQNMVPGFFSDIDTVSVR